MSLNRFRRLPATATLFPASHRAPHTCSALRTVHATGPLAGMRVGSSDWRCIDVCAYVMAIVSVAELLTLDAPSFPVAEAANVIPPASSHTQLRCCDVGDPFVCTSPAPTPVLVQLHEVEILMAARATVVPCSTQLYLHSHNDHVHLLFVGGWSGTGVAGSHLPTTFTWHIVIPASGFFHFSVIAAHSFKLAPSTDVTDSLPPPVLLRVCVEYLDREDRHHDGIHPYHDSSDDAVLCCGAQLVYRDVHAYGQFSRVACTSPLFLDAGPRVISLTASAEDGHNFCDLSLFSVELESEDLRKEIAHDLLTLSSRSHILQSYLDFPDPPLSPPRNFGIFTHWNFHSLPLASTPLSFADSVAAFNASTFAAAAAAASASFVVFTATWASFYLPAPIAAVDRVLPGRTSEIDLLGRIMHALQEQGIKLILYLHYGKDDPEWWTVSRFPTAEWWQSWCDIVQEIGHRYGENLAGWWIDDGMTGYYPWRAPFRKMWKALKHGNRDRIVGYNQYYFPSPTRLQDFIAGELSIVDVPALRLSFDSQTRVVSSAKSWPSLHATFSTTLEEGDWTFMRGGSVDSRTGTVHGASLDFSRNYSFPPLLYDTADLLAHVVQARDRNIWPIFNVLISQEGIMNPRAISQLANVASGLACSRLGIYVPTHPQNAQLPSSLARTGPLFEGPIFWRQTAQLVSWEHEKAFASWLLDIQECKSSVRVTLSSQCPSAALTGLSVSLLPRNSCQMTNSESKATNCWGAGDVDHCGEISPRYSGGWICNTSTSSVILLDLHDMCDVSGLKRSHALLPIAIQDSNLMPRSPVGTADLVWLLVTRSVPGDANLDIAIAGGQVSCV